jgi:hypothetical protein
MIPPWTKESPLAKPARITRVLLERNEEGLVLLLKVRSDAEESEVELRFIGVTQLRFRGETTELLGLVLLQFKEMTSQGWEEARFRVKDWEEEFLSFYCKTIERVVAPPSETSA